MSSQADPSRSTLLMSLAAVIVVWGVAGTIGAGDTPYSGYFTDGDNTVIQVQGESPAQAAGLQTGDVITTIGGIPVTDTRAAVDRGRPEIGETQSIVVDRDGQTATMNLEYAALPSAQSLAGHLGSLIGLSFLLFSVWAYRKTPNATTGTLAWFGICFGLIFMAAPYFTSATVRTVVGVVTTVAVIAGLALLLDFVMQTGTDEAYTDQKSTPKWIYWPAAGVGALLVALTVFQPATSSGMNLALRLITGVLFAGYFGGSLVLMMRNYSGADAATRESRKLGMMLAGTVLGLGPLTLLFVVQLVSPSTVIPTGQYWFLALAAIPVTFALAAVHASGAAMVPQSAGAAPAVGSQAPAPVPAAPQPVAPAPPAAAPAAPTPAPEPLRAQSVGGTDQVADDETVDSGDSGGVA